MAGPCANRRAREPRSAHADGKRDGRGSTAGSLFAAGGAAGASLAKDRHLVDGDSRAGPRREVDSWVRAGRRGGADRGGAVVPIEECMFKRVINAVIGTRHERERKKIQPIVDEINEHFARLHDVPEAELRAQTEKFRGIIKDRTGALEAQVASLKEQKRNASDPLERDRIDAELSGSDGRGGAEGKLRHEIAEVLDELLPEAFAT